MLPLTAITSPLFGWALVSTGFGVGGGILAEQGLAVAALGQAAWSLAARLRCPSLDLRGGPFPGEDWVRDDTTYLGFVRRLAANDAAELLAVPRKQRAELRKALAADLTVDVVPIGLPAARIMRSMRKASAISARPYSPRRCSRRCSRRSGRRRTSSPCGTNAARWQACSASIGGAPSIPIGAAGRKRRGGCARFDFGRSKAGTGVAAFKKNWGFVPEPLVYFSRHAKGAAPRSINPLDSKYRLQIAAWKRLPLWAANCIGPLLSRGLG